MKIGIFGAMAQEVEILSGVESGKTVITIGWHNVNDSGDVEIVS